MSGYPLHKNRLQTACQQAQPHAQGLLEGSYSSAIWDRVLLGRELEFQLLLALDIMSFLVSQVTFWGWFIFVLGDWPAHCSKVSSILSGIQVLATSTTSNRDERLFVYFSLWFSMESPYLGFSRQCAGTSAEFYTRIWIRYAVDSWIDVFPSANYWWEFSVLFTRNLSFKNLLHYV